MLRRLRVGLVGISSVSRHLAIIFCSFSMLLGVFVLAHHRKLKNVTVLKGDIINLIINRNNTIVGRR